MTKDIPLYPGDPKLREFLLRWQNDPGTLTWDDVTMLLSIVEQQHRQICDLKYRISEYIKLGGQAINDLEKQLRDERASRNIKPRAAR